MNVLKKKHASISDLFEKVISQFLELNFLINNAGIMRKINFHTKEVDLEDINSEIEINLSGLFRMVKQQLSKPVDKMPTQTKGNRCL